MRKIVFALLVSLAAATAPFVSTASSASCCGSGAACCTDGVCCGRK